MQQIKTSTTEIGCFRMLTVLAALASAASSLVVVARPAEATFPGKNGNIFFASDRDGDYDQYGNVAPEIYV